MKIRKTTQKFDNIVDIYYIDVEIADTFDSQNKIKATARWDTGAMKTTISGAVAKGLGISKMGDVMTHTANGIAFGEEHLANFVLSGGLAINDLEIISMPDMFADCLLGTDVIARGDFCVSNSKGRTVVSFKTK